MEEHSMNISKFYKLLLFLITISVSQFQASAIMDENLFLEACKTFTTECIIQPVVTATSHPAVTATTHYIRNICLLGVIIAGGLYGLKQYLIYKNKSDLNEQKNKSAVEKSLSEQRELIIQEKGYQISETTWIYEQEHKSDANKVVVHTLEKQAGFSGKLTSKAYDKKSPELQGLRNQALRC